MAITVKEIVQDIVSEFPADGEIDVEHVMEFNDGIERIDVVNAMKALEFEGQGILWKGRRGKKTRFIKGAKRTIVEIDKEDLQQFEEHMDTMAKGDTILVSFDECEKRLKDDPELKEELEKYRGQKDVSFFFGKTTSAVDALKHLQHENRGTFIIGRRGKFSRFIVGMSKQDLIAKPKGLILTNIEEEQKPVRYDIKNNVIFKTYDGQFISIKDAINELGTEISEELIAKELDDCGFFVNIKM